MAQSNDSCRLVDEGKWGRVDREKQKSGRGESVRSCNDKVHKPRTTLPRTIKAIVVTQYLYMSQNMFFKGVSRNLSHNAIVPLA